MTYRTWVTCLTRFATGDDVVLDEIATLQIDWQPGVAERFTARVAGAFQQRLEKLQSRLQRDLDAGFGDITGVGQSLSRARTQLVPLVRLSRLPSLPEQVQVLLRDELARILKEMDQSLERSIDTRSQIGIELLSQVRQNRMAGVLEADPASSSLTATPPTTQQGRRAIIL